MKEEEEEEEDGEGRESTLSLVTARIAWTGGGLLLLLLYCILQLP